MRKLVFLLACVVLGITVEVKAQSAPKLEYDTVKKTLIQWVDDVKTGHITSGYAIRITTYQVGYSIADTTQIGKEEVKAKKTRTATIQLYYQYKVIDGKEKPDYSKSLINLIADYNFDPSAPKKE